MLGTVIDALRDLLGADRATVWVHDAARKQLVSRVAHGVSGGAGELRIPDGAGIAGACAQSRTAVHVPDAYADERFDQSVDRKTGYRTRNILAFPLLDGEGGLVGVAQVLNRASPQFSREDDALAHALAAQAAVAIQRARLLEDRLARLRLQEELEVARSIQQSSFPKSLPTIAGYELAARTIPAEECGGDGVDAIPLRRGLLADPGEPCDGALLLCADATGHGVGPALSSMQTCGMVRAAIRFGQPIARIVPEVNRQLCDVLPSGRFVTAWLGRLDLRTHSVECFSAGQGPILIYRAATDAFEELDSDAPPFGVLTEGFPSFGLPPHPLAPGDIFLVLTDGYFEAPSPTGEQFERARLEAVVREARHLHPDEILTRLDEAVLRFTGATATPDDRTGVILKRLP